MNIKQETIDKFMSYVSPEALTGCWIWTGGIHNQGYGMFNGSGIKKTITAHRFSAIIHGLDISGPVLRHKCHNPICCNPDHLETGTQQDNMNDMVKAGRNKNQGNHGRKYPAELIEKIRNEYATGNITQAELSRKYVIDTGYMSGIIRRIRR
jgi:hypothetical protein